MFRKLINLTIWYFNRTKAYSTPRFIVELTLLSFILKILFFLPYLSAFFLFGTFLQDFSNIINPDSAQNWGLSRLDNFVLAFIFPPVETILFQAIPILITSIFTKRISTQVIISASVFALIHLELPVIPVVFPVGIILAWSFVFNKQKSIWRAFWVTTAIHFFHNLIAGVILPTL